MENKTGRVAIAMSVPPLGESYQTAGLQSVDVQEQYRALLQGLKGGDIFLLETMASIEETRMVSEWVTSITDRPEYDLSTSPVHACGLCCNCRQPGCARKRLPRLPSG